jgi:hypothetical protein
MSGLNGETGRAVHGGAIPGLEEIRSVKVILKINFFGFMKIVLGSALASTPAPQFL